MLDQKDREILAALQENAMLTSEMLGARVHLSPSQAARRRQRLESQGTITGYRARLDPAQIGLGVQAFVQVQMATHTPDGAKSFKGLLADMPQVVNAWTLTGEADYLLRVWCADLSALNTLIHDRLLPHPAVARVQSQIVMEQLKQAAALPV
ncbi:DNA-binding Lrp family transcriptional regulator [Roseinatronobacter thiooxidans]|uniref:DNA-binding Lrp family transcriptional regulator n=1 Tax=Roseinatronobacter thiooxidans TaxID=121821 RepID=A0A2W7PMF7_9RHOB|nr:Lrp/AsnC family transcriptional regulator [Roseinatronobacter thiooxidans]PZX36736.1 DNA-binding Lrp family transcriptional regulator [Roseinatronobacter thiooxidans]